ncbi:Tat pathway signal sequence domain protein [Actinomyces urogenitalis DSM 15434]|uniref:Tat pathway signal sequence domain protein n=4 Tax=Actinomyces urogenitalis TaxID=103621 RepID=C0W451_9ACTO|nr:Tat pathway signal sequence domain protein [Actinomyces urogenitalis DSM 15434]MBS5977808.1 thioredoxin domain-containing protein [Actinomyces urogenitalis]MBS6073017.1 thioredoxin domain-containing protein [Actinomyces urogenitalis]PKY98449.1 disulfide bond formation protein DsbA [Actinomyces urogenitalis]
MIDDSFVNLTDAEETRVASNSTRPTKAERRSAARAQAQALREEQERKERRAKITRRSLLGVGALAVVGVGAGLAYSAREDGSQGSAAVATGKANKDGVPSVVLSDGSWSYGKGMVAGTVNDGAKVLDVFFDYSCHFCVAFETLHADEITDLVNAGTVTLVLHPCKILGMDWTDMVMNAQGLVLDEDPEHALEFHNTASALFTKIYNAQDTSMMTADNLVAAATEAGVSQEVSTKFADAIKANTYGAWTELGTQTFQDKGFTGTPTILLDGESVDLSAIGTATGLTDLIKKG